MDKDAYIEQLQAENTQLKQRLETLEKHIERLEKYITQMEKHIENLERRLGMNSRNSSQPPSSDPPGVAAVLPLPRRKKRGARKGHPPHGRALLPPEMVQRRVELAPVVCPCGSTRLMKTPQKPRRHQIIDIPPIVPQVTEYLQPVYRCRDCGALVYQPVPDTIKRRCCGSGLPAIVGILTGSLNTSKRKVLALLHEVFRVPMSLGGLSHGEGQLTDIMEAPYQETRADVQAQPVAHADETGWWCGRRFCGARAASAPRANAGPAVRSVSSPWAPPAACRDGALWTICVMRVAAIPGPSCPIVNKISLLC
jgi:transposase